MHTDILPLLACPTCRAALTVSGGLPSDSVETGALVCAAGHEFKIVNGVPRFLGHELNDDQARARDSFGYEWTELYPEQRHSEAERNEERRVFLEYTRTLPSDYRGKLVLDAGCGNGRYAKFTNEWGARVVAVDMSSAVEVAARNLAGRGTVDVVQADLFRLPFRDGVFDIAYSVGVLHHTPDAAGAFQSVAKAVRPGGSFAIFVHAQGNRVLHGVNRLLRRFTSRASPKSDVAVLARADRLRQGAAADPAGRSPGRHHTPAARVLLTRPAQQFRSLQCRLHELSSSTGSSRLVPGLG